MFFLTLFVLFCKLVCVKTQKPSVITGSTLFGLLPISCADQLFSANFSTSTDDKQIIYYIVGSGLKEGLILGISVQETCKTVSENTKLKYHKDPIAVTNDKDLIYYRHYICQKKSRIPQKDSAEWVNLESIKEIITDQGYMLSPFAAIPIIVCCFAMSSLMSGLNIGLMSLDPHELQLIKNAGTEREKKYATKIIPVRKNGNYLLCSILLTATLCNSAATVLIDNFVSSWLAVVVTTLTIVVLCEILPQAICNYFPLLIGYYTIYITKLCMIITAPLSYPLGKLLNLILGKEMAATYTKARLKELLKMTELPTNEERIISGTLDLSHKKVEDVMTMLDDTFKLPITAVMDFETIAKILESGYSRIPIYAGDKSNIVHLLLTKDLALLDPDDKVPVEILVKHSKYNLSYIPVGTTLDNVLVLFKESRGHMAFVVGKEVDDKFLKDVVGIVTFEDIIEEIFQEEINDETDTYFDNRSKRRLSKQSERSDLFTLLTKYSTQTTPPSENLKLAIFHFLSAIEIFSSKHISPTVLLSVLNLDIYYSAPGKKVPEDTIYVQGVPVDFFVMLIEGEVEVRIGHEDLKFKAGAFKYFGTDALKKGQLGRFEPDYSLQAVRKTSYIKISKTLYNAAILATNYEKYKKIPDINSKSELFKYFKVLIKEDPNN